MPKPALGDVVFRENLSGQYEEATVTAILTPSIGSPNWTATMMTRNGVEFLGSDIELKSKHEWMPLGWTLEHDTWLEPETGGSGLQGKVASLEETVANLTTKINNLTNLINNFSTTTNSVTVTADDVDNIDPFDTVVGGSTTVVTLPEPQKNEKFMTWRSRAVKSTPFLKVHENGQDILRDAWHNKTFENIEVTL
tara:strand:+ start:2177 stop:2761 length:585 start_codon:yes stop_codon:yes gene_type:complete